ncbi:MAG: NAD(P)-dependent oxidoreductase [Actinomycetales bacterium]|nr:NAD(P)-dependent oxidoreductase [Actinomycetales bacterium]
MTSETTSSPRAPVVVTGANGFVGSYVTAALVDRGVSVRAIVRRPRTAPDLPGVEEIVGEFHDRDVADRACSGARAVVNTVHPMQDDDGPQESAVGWAAALAEAARDAGVPLFVHVSTTSVYERKAGTPDVDEFSPLVDDDANEYAVTKRDTELRLHEVDGITRVLVRPTAILGPGESSVWNTLQPESIRTEESARTDDPERTFGWLHVHDLADLIADIAVGAIPLAQDPEQGPVPGLVTPVNAVTGNVRLREYLAPVCEALGVEPVWETREAFRAQLRADRARAWGWSPKVSFEDAMAELVTGLR